MEKNKKSKTSESSMEISPFWRFGWPEIDRAFDTFRRDFERTFSAFPSDSVGIPHLNSLSCDVIDEGNKFHVKVDLPGVKKEEIKLNVSDSMVEISAEHKQVEEEKKKNYVRKERKELAYHRTLPLPEKVNSSKTVAKLDNGILTIEIPKITPTPKPKSSMIEVK